MRQDTPSESLIQWGRSAALLSINSVLADSSRAHSLAFADMAPDALEQFAVTLSDLLLKIIDGRSVLPGPACNHKSIVYMGFENPVSDPVVFRDITVGV